MKKKILFIILVLYVVVVVISVYLSKKIMKEPSWKQPSAQKTSVQPLIPTPAELEKNKEAALASSAQKADLQETPQAQGNISTQEAAEQGLPLEKGESREGVVSKEFKEYESKGLILRR